MRTQDMFHLINRTRENWVYPDMLEQKKNGTINCYVCRNVHELVPLLEPLRIFQDISEQIDIIYKTDKTFQKGEPVILTPDEKRSIELAMDKIRESLNAMCSMCEALGLDRDSSGFDIKLPPDITLGELAACAKDLDNIFRCCPLFCSEDEQIEFHGVDVGSAWLTFTIVGAGAATAFYILNNLAAMVSKILSIREQMAVCKQQEETYRQAGLKNDILQAVVEANKEILNKLTRNAVEELAQDNGITDPEKLEQIKGSLTLMEKWTDKGMEVYAAVEAPEEIKAVFPPPEAQVLPDFMMKMLKDRESEEE